MNLYFFCKLTGWSPVAALLFIIATVIIGVLLSTGLGLALVKAFLDWLERRDSK